ncbi:stage II sporulation protein R [Bacillus fonticola]|uniref:stage II sporulation protein R n=1 Tax=Bacillus fonticola TaxID=2728853 RepID=UPI001473B2DA|nr:stage II sporulation protein R [Bacillus fonticola]
MKINKKYFASLYICILVLGTIASLSIPKTEATANSRFVIPEEAMRLRILANSDMEVDQALKRDVRDEVNIAITEWMEGASSFDEASKVMQEKLPEITKIAERVVEESGLDQDVKVEYGMIKFPTKLYGNLLYPAGEYEAVLISLGEAKGSNWWCVLFPNLCFVDSSNGMTTQTGNGVDDVKIEQREDGVEDDPMYVDGEGDKPQAKFFLVEMFQWVLDLF